MAKGFDVVDKVVERIETKKRAFTESGDIKRKLYFKVNEGTPEIVRFVGDMQSAYVHQLEPQGKLAWGEKVVCRDQDEDLDPIGESCPGCEQGLRRSFQAWYNVIWRNAPVFDRDEEGRLVKDRFSKNIIIGNEDQIAIWQFGITVSEQLKPLNKKLKGIDSRDFEVTRTGEKTGTKYSVLPADIDGGPQPLSEQDEALVVDLYDLEELSRPPTYEQWGKAWTPNSGGSEKAEVESTDVNAFFRKKER